MITDIASYKQVTMCKLEKDWKGLEDYIMRKTPNALTCNIIDCKSIFDLTVRSSDAPATLLEHLVSIVHENLSPKWMSDHGLRYMLHAVTTGKSKLIEILMRYNKDLPNLRDEENLLPIHYAAKLSQRDAARYLLSNTTVDDRDGIILLKDLISSNLFGKYYSGERNSYFF